MLPCPPPRRGPQCSQAPREARMDFDHYPRPRQTLGTAKTRGPADPATHANFVPWTRSPRRGRSRSAASTPPATYLVRAARGAPGSLTITRLESGPWRLRKTAGRRRLPRTLTLYLGLGGRARPTPQHCLNATRRVVRARRARRAWFFDHYTRPLRALGTVQDREPAEADTHANFVPWPLTPPGPSRSAASTPHTL